MTQVDTKPHRRFFENWFDVAPGVFAALAFAAGFIAILTVAAPSLPHLRGLDAIERLIAEFPEFGASVGGVALMGLATGLRRRIDSAWAASTALFGAGSLYAFFRHDHLPIALASGVVALALLVSRRAFYRRSRMSKLAPAPKVALAIAGALAVGIMGALLWAGARPGFAEAPWWALLTDPHLGRPGRSLSIAIAAFGLWMANRYFLERPKGAPAPAGDEAFARVEHIIAAAPDAPPDAQMAFGGYKSFTFVDDAFVMSAKGGASLISMLGPIGKRDSWRPALIAFREEAARLSLRPVVYAAPPELLPDLIEIGFRIEKVGENALIDLSTFSLTGAA
jgi:lysylphosphatidylglycerol synthetase-like protein (DUF2156 family)